MEEEFKEGGQRDYIQVFSNSLFAIVIAVVYNLYVLDRDDLIPLISFKMNGLRNMLFCGYYAGYACCNADTWASEIGILSTS